MRAFIAGYWRPKKQEFTIPVLGASTKNGLAGILQDQPAGDGNRALTEEYGQVLDVMEDIPRRLLALLHHVCKNLSFWQAKAEAPEAEKVRVMVLERGPKAFFMALYRLAIDLLIITPLLLPASSSAATAAARPPSLREMAAALIAERVALLSRLRDCLATALGQVYIEGHRLERDIHQSKWQATLPRVLRSVHQSLKCFEGVYAVPQTDFPETGKDGDVIKLHLRLAPDKKLAGGELPEGKAVGAALHALRGTVEALLYDVSQVEECIVTLMHYYRRPRRVERFWIPYTAGALLLAAASSWLLHHREDLRRWANEAYDSAGIFVQEHAVAPLIAIRDDLFTTFRKRPHSITEQEEVKLTSESLRRMLVAFAEHSEGGAAVADLSEQELMERMMSKYEKEVEHPLKSLMGGDLARAMLIQVQKLKLDIETAMLELDQILRANEINFAVLAALPAFLLSFILMSIARQVAVSKGKGRDWRGRAAQLQRRLLMVDVERAIMDCQLAQPEGIEGPPSEQVGRLIYTLHLLYRAVQWPAKRAGEWKSLRRDILDLAQPDLRAEQKLLIAARMERIYECLQPMIKL